MIPRVRGTVGHPVRLEGYAYDFGHAVGAVQFSLNDGATWTTYGTPGTNDYQNLSWSFEYVPQRAGFYRMLVRSVNDRGETSPHNAVVELVVAEAGS